MAIDSIIFHKLERYQESEPSDLKLAQDSPAKTADHEALFSQFKKVFNSKPGKFFGHFDPDFGTHTFQTLLTEQQNQKMGFVSLTHSFMEEFKRQLDSQTELFDAHFAFIEEDRADGRRLYILVIESSRGLQFDNKLDLDTVEYISTSRLDFALRVDLEDWLNSDETPHYLCAVKGRSNGKIGDIFIDCCGFVANVDSKKETEALMDILTKYTQDQAPSEAKETRQKAYDFCVEQQQLGESVPLNELSGYLDEKEPTRFTQFAKQQDSMTDKSELRPDTRKLKHLVRMSGKGNGLSLSFSSDLMQNTILYDDKHDQLTITEIPKTLKQQIMRFLQEKEED